MSGTTGVDMNVEASLERLCAEFNASAFNRNYYQVDVPFSEFIRGVLRYLDQNAANQLDLGEISVQEAAALVMNSVPSFQRDNDKWTPLMQSQYVRNVLRGMRGSPIMLYRFGNKQIEPCKVIDGLQRITAILRFFTDDEMPIESISGEVFTAAQIRNSEAFHGYLWNVSVPLRIYSFGNEVEAVDFYIEMNEGITHAESDIKKAREYRASLAAK